MTGVLYISYDGMMEPLGQSQVITYLERLSLGRHVHLISYEKAGDWRDGDRRRAVAARLARGGIVWHPLAYHKSPTVPATLYDALRGAVLAAALCWRHGLRIVHARSYVPAVIGAAARTLTGARLVFDMRGLWPDEKVDGGAWGAQSRAYRWTKRIEAWLLRRADHVVTLTQASLPVLRRLGLPGWTPVSVIPTCADLERFAPPASNPAPASSRVFTLGYVGSIGTRYLFDEVVAVFALIRAQRPGARLLVVNRNDPGLVIERVRAAGLPVEAVQVVAADHAAVPGLIRQMDAGTAFYASSFSTVATAPTKLGEYLGCGVPCLGNAGVGDMDQVLANDGAPVGVVMPDFTPESRAQAVAQLLALCDAPDTGARCRAAAQARFAVTAGVRAYARIWDGERT
ncbi:glycosyltransferase [Novosphingobium sp. FSY-8]|uniref:Glycosyltransferase n=1 Tax=Novosphingobium ovatum TaxID=1908523 RepID=A0ABW9X8T4_9SPHN|nr:glycosyltransferase [Novosphingobium ovatum]NBC34938.1 glycosyltransferase [Novosphingobium ovatum]